MTIDEFARRMSTSVRNVRAYQDRGLLPPPRLVGRTGYYDEAHVDRLVTVQRLQKEGFSLAAIGALLTAWDAGSTLDEVMGAQRRLGAATNGAVDASTLFPVTKFERPNTRPEHVTRRRCLELLAAERDSHVLVVAPGGSGKSTLAAQLASTCDAAAWVSLASADNEPGCFWTAVLIALRTALPGFGDDLLAEVIGGSAVDRLLVRMSDRLTAEGRPVSLVLDDLHEITDGAIMRQIGWLLGRLDAAVCRLVMCSRTRPALATAQLVMAGRLIVLETGQVSFDDAETRELLLEKLGVTVSREESHDITEGTDGWPAAIYLSGLALRSGTSIRSVIESVSTPDRRVQEYFAEEILQAIDPRHLGFLEDISVLERFTAELCDVVRDSSDSAAILDELHTNMFVIRLDPIGFWQRLHHTLAAVLRARVATSTVDTGPRHLRAARWYAAHDHVPEAIEHYVRAGAHDEAARIVGALYPRFMNISHQGAAVERWLQMLPIEIVSTSPELSLASAGIGGLHGDAVSMNRWLALAESLSQNNIQTKSVALFMRACFNFGEIESALVSARDAYAILPHNELWFPMQGAALVLLSLWADGPQVQMLSVVDTVLTDESTVHQPIAATGLWALRAVVQAAHGLPGAAASLQRANEIRRDSHIDRAPQAANTWSTTARAHRLLGEVDQAAADGQAGYEIVADLAPERDATGAVVPLLIELAHARRAQGRITEARQYITEARRRLAGIAGPGRLPQLLNEAAAGL